MVELVDTQHLNCCEATRAGSIPALGTTNKTPDNSWVFCFRRISPYININTLYHNYLNGCLWYNFSMSKQMEFDTDVVHTKHAARGEHYLIKSGIAANQQQVTNVYITAGVACVVVTIMIILFTVISNSSATNSQPDRNITTNLAT